MEKKCFTYVPEQELSKLSLTHTLKTFAERTLDLYFPFGLSYFIHFLLLPFAASILENLCQQSR